MYKQDGLRIRGRRNPQCASYGPGRRLELRPRSMPGRRGAATNQGQNSYLEATDRKCHHGLDMGTGQSLKGTDLI